MKIVLVCVLASAITSYLVAKAIAAHHFKVIDSYVRDVIDLAKKQIDAAYINQGKH